MRVTRVSFHARTSSLRSPRRRGAASAETCVILPFLMLMALGTVDLGRYCYAYVATVSAARNAAYYGSRSLQGAADADGMERVARTELTGVPGVTTSNPTVQSEIVTVNGPTHRLVKATVKLRFDTIIAYPALPSSLTLTGTAEMRIMPDLE